MPLPHRSQPHRGCRRSHKSRARPPCGSAGRRDALAASKPTASRLPPLPQKQSAARPCGSAGRRDALAASMPTASRLPPHKSSARRPCGSAGRRDAFRTSKPTASRLPPLPQKQCAAPCGSAGRRDALATSKPTASKPEASRLPPAPQEQIGGPLWEPLPEIGRRGTSPCRNATRPQCERLYLAVCGAGTRAQRSGARTRHRDLSVLRVMT
jgi:hypothetical protein